MLKRTRVGGIWVVLMWSGVLACIQNVAAEQPKMPGKVLISDVIITGNERMSKEQIRVRMRSQPGSDYNPAVVDEDVRELYKTGQFSKIETLSQPDGNDRVKIHFNVCVMPNMVQKVTFLGNKHIKPDALKSLTGVRESTPLNPNLNHQGCQKILEKYAEQGRSFADCQLIKGGDLADTEVVYQITEGPKVKVSDIKFEGNHFVTAARLNSLVKSTPEWFHLIGANYNRQMVDADVNELCNYYRSFGFQDVRISKEEQRSADGGEVTLIFHIQEGPRSRIADDSQQ
ncbi:MAG TPA: POTRA domain-containing protein [Gemmataceae bacterium]|jgi:outer membrane protein insertion porin family